MLSETKDTARRWLYAGQQAQQCALARPGRSQKAKDFTRQDLQSCDLHDRTPGIVLLYILQLVDPLLRRHAHGLSCARTITRLAASARARSHAPRARAKPNSPLPVSSTMAVVMTRVWP